MRGAVRIPIDIPGHPTSLVVERGALGRLGAMLESAGVAVSGRPVLLAFDANVEAHALHAVPSLENAGARVTRIALDASEARKSIPQVEALWRAALEARLDRGGLVVALGGGLVGDLAGFAAATYLRGIDLVQLPTTLLAMVDAAIGGKTGVNLELPGGGLGKNLAGAFWQPRITIADPAVLSTLPPRELRAGLAECVKHAVIAGEAQLAAIERDAIQLAAGDPDALDALVPASAAVKAGIVARDPFERGDRALLNLGHTFGHAIETVPEFALLHGEAVAIGCAAAASSAVACGMLDAAAGERIRRAIAAVGLPTGLPGPFPVAEARRRMGFDKKATAGRLRLVLPKAIGEVVVVPDPSDATVEAGLRAIGCE